MSMIRWVKTRTERYRRSRKGLSTILANLLMLIIVVFLSAMLFVWATASFSTYQGGAGYWFSSKSLANQERISVEYVGFTGPSGNIAHIYVRNVGAIPFTLASVYVNSTLLSTLNLSVNINSSCQLGTTCISGSGITMPSPFPQAGKLQTVTVATLRGTTITTTWVA